MRAVVVVVCLVAACGRMGFDPGDSTDAPIASDGEEILLRVDAVPPIDADPATPDAVVGTGTYAVTESVAPYVSAAGVVVPGFVNGADDETYVVDLPFTFTLYGVAYTSMTISVNGYVAFGAPVTAVESYENDCPIDATPPDAMIAVFWDDLFASNVFDPRGTITMLAEGTTPDQRFTIEWKDLDAWYQQGMSYWAQKLRLTHKLVLHENGSFDFHYGPRTPPEHDNEDCGIDRHRGCSATIGIEASGSGAAKTVQCGTAAGPMAPFTLVDEGRMITFTPL